jgi:hypothetical protein
MTITAKYPSTCAACGGKIVPGDKIEWEKGQKARHTKCSTGSTAQASDATPAPYKIHGGSGYGCHGWESGQIVRSEKHLREKGYPEFLFVVRASRRYFREEGMSFGVGDESGYTYGAECREASAEESAPLRAEIEARRTARNRQAEIELTFRTIAETGEYPKEESIPEGEEVAVPNSGERLYGQGSWFVVGPEWIWAVKNNGMDGDDWGRNNVRTGGAGAIGHRVARTEELAAKILAWK